MPKKPRDLNPGIYKWTNKINGKVYVGGAKNGIRIRHGHYLKDLPRGTCHNILLQRAWDKYGAEAFEFSIVQCCKAENVRDRENYWIKKLKAADRRYGYNIQPTANRGNFGVKASPETRAKIGAASRARMTPAMRAHLAEMNTGRKISEKTRKKMSIANTGRKQSPDAIERSAAKRRGQKRSEETRRRSSIAARKRWEKIGPRERSRRMSSLMTPQQRSEMVLSKGLNKGRKHTPEARENMKEGIKKSKKFRRETNYKKSKKGRKENSERIRTAWNDPEKRKRMEEGAKKRRRPVEERIWEKVQKRGLDECWIWTGCKNPGGYAMIHNGKRQKAAHKIIWEIQNGKVPEGLCVLHKCIDLSCLNPQHLFLGTRSDSIANTIAKGRDKHTGPKNANKGEIHPLAKLTEKEAKEIRRRYIPRVNARDLAEEFGVAAGRIRMIASGKSWKHLSA
jgi:group I intron endonuclease